MSSSSGRTIGEALQHLRLATEGAQAARADPAIQASMAAEYEGRLVDAPELRRRSREADWRARGIPERLFPMLHDGAADEPELGDTSRPLAPGPLAPKPTPALTAVDRFLEPSDPKTILVLAGEVGTGKTVAAAWGAAVGRGRMVKAIDLLRAGLYPQDPLFWPRLYTEKLLVVDDLGAEPLDAKGHQLAVISDVVDRRYDAGKKTIVTTNLAQAQFRERYGTGPGERLWRRICEVGRWIDLPARAREGR